MKWVWQESAKSVSARYWSVVCKLFAALSQCGDSESHVAVIYILHKSYGVANSPDLVYT